MGRSLACSRNSKEASITGAERVRKRVVGDKVRDGNVLDHIKLLGFYVGVGTEERLPELGFKWVILLQGG